MKLLHIEHCIDCIHWNFDIKDNLWVYWCEKTGIEIYRELDNDDHNQFDLFAKESIPDDCPLSEALNEPHQIKEIEDGK